MIEKFKFFAWISVFLFLEKFWKSSFAEPLEQDALRYFAAIPDTASARYHKPFQNVNAFFNWLVSQEYLSKNPLKANGLSKRKDDGGNASRPALRRSRAFWRLWTGRTIQVCVTMPSLSWCWIPVSAQGNFWICILPILMQRRAASSYQSWLQRHGKSERFI